MKKIQIITPSSNIVDEIENDKNIKDYINNALIFLKNINLEVVFGELFYKKTLWYAGSIKERISEIHNAFLNKKIDFIMTSQGGYNSNELLKYLDYDLIKKNYKPIIGLSDITILLNAIFTKTGMITYHGYDFLWQIGKSAGEFSKKELNNFFNEGKIQNEIIGQNFGKNIIGEGILIGGCIPSYSLILNTEFDPINLDKKFIFFIEDIGESAERILSYITQLLNNELFIKNCKGFILGNFSFCDFESDKSLNLYEIIIERLNQNLDIPILKIERIGHIVENYILPIGKKVNILDNKLILNA